MTVSTSYRPTTTRQEAEQYVSRCLGEHAAEHDVPAITDKLYGLVGSWDVGAVDGFDFWEVVKAHALTEHDVQAAALVALRDQIDGVNHTNARLAQADSLTGRNLEHVMVLSRDLEVACEAFRRAHYPRRHKVIVALGSVCVLSVKGRHSEIVWERS